MMLIVDIGQQDVGEALLYTTTNVSAVVEQVEITCPCTTKGLAFAFKSVVKVVMWSGVGVWEGSADEAKLEQTPWYPFHSQLIGVIWA